MPLLCTKTYLQLQFVYPPHTKTESTPTVVGVKDRHNMEAYSSLSKRGEEVD